MFNRKTYNQIHNKTPEAKASRKKYAQSQKGKAWWRNHQLVKLYGITAKEFDDMFAVQGSRCKACGSLTSRHKHHWNVDHDHKTGKVRGILCWPCNAALGMVQDNSQQLRQLADYLERNG